MSHHLESTPHFPETAFNDIGSANHLSDALGETEHGDQFIEIGCQTVDRAGCLLLPPLPPLTKVFGGHGRRGGIHDLFGFTQTCFSISFGTIVGNITQLVDPAELMLDPGIYRFRRLPQTIATIHHQPRLAGLPFNPRIFKFSKKFCRQSADSDFTF